MQTLRQLGRLTRRLGPQAALPARSSGRFKCAANFFFELKTLHCSVPIGIALAAAISWYSHSSTKRSVITSRSLGSRNAIQSRNSKEGSQAFGLAAENRSPRSSRATVGASRVSLVKCRQAALRAIL